MEFKNLSYSELLINFEKIVTMKTKKFVFL